MVFRNLVKHRELDLRCMVFGNLMKSRELGAPSACKFMFRPCLEPREEISACDSTQKLRSEEHLRPQEPAPTHTIINLRNCQTQQGPFLETEN